MAAACLPPVSGPAVPARVVRVGWEGPGVTVSAVLVVLVRGDRQGPAVLAPVGPGATFQVVRSDRLAATRAARPQGRRSRRWPDWQSLRP